MTDSTQVTLPAAQAFLSGKLEMSEHISKGIEAAGMAWAEYPANTIAVIIFTILALLTMKSLLNLYPMLFDSLTRWKGCVNIDSSIRLKSDRNLLGMVWLLPLVLMADRYGLFSIGLLDGITAQWHVFGTMGVVVSWLVLRHIFYFLCSIRVKRPETFKTVHMSLYNFLIQLSVLMILTAGAVSFTNVPDHTSRAIILYEAIAFYLVALLRERQILGTFCSPFRSFLYLCEIEIIPTGALVAANILL